MTTGGSTTPTSEPERIAGTVGLVSLAIGIVIGSGIFKVPGYVYAAAGDDPRLALLFWMVGGVFALTGALTTAELAAMFPRQGGTFVYVREAYGPYGGFVVGCCSFLVGFPASIAAIAHVFGEYAGIALGRTGSEVGLGALLLCAAAAANLQGSRRSYRLQTLLTGLKVALVIVFATALLLAPTAPATDGQLPSSASRPSWSFSTVMSGLIAVYWTFDGWQNLGVVAGEARAPERTLVRSLVGTLALVLALYLLVNLGLFRALPPEVLSGHETPGAAAALAALGPLGERLLAGLVAVSTATAVFALFVAGPRFLYALGRAGVLFEAAGRLDPQTRAPRVAVGALWGMALAYLLSGSFGQTLSLYAFVGLTMQVVGVTALFTLRAARPEVPRPFRVPLYPLVPLFYAGLCGSMVVGAALAEPARCALGAGLMALTYPAYRLWLGRAATA